MKAHVTLFSNTKANHGTPSQGTWPDLINSCLGTRGDLSVHELFSPATFTNDKRANENIKQVYALVLDFDGKHFDPKWVEEENRKKLAENPDAKLTVIRPGSATTIAEAIKRWSYYGWWHRTRSHKDDYPSFRILIPLENPVSEAEHRSLYDGALAHERELASVTSIDDMGNHPAHIWFMPENQDSWELIDGPVLTEDEWLGWQPKEKQDSKGSFDPTAVPLEFELSDNETRIAAYLAGMPPSITGENGSTACFNAARKVADFEINDPARIVELLELYYNPQCSPPWSRKELEHKAKDALKSRIKNPIPIQINVPTPAAGPKGYQPEAANKVFGPLIQDKKGKIISRLHNFVYLIHQTFAGIVRFDNFLQKVRATGPLPWSPTGYPRDWRDVDSLRMCTWLEKTHGLSASEPKTCNAITVVAEANKYDSYIDHMNELPAWDGVERLSTWLTTYLGVFETKYSRTVGRAFLIAMAARALKPGTKVQNVLVLEGSQGLGKSEVAEIIAGRDEWFTSSIPDLQSKDAAMTLQGKSVVELAELAAMKRSNNESSKEFITRNFDKFRPPYGRNEITSPRRCVFIATTNHDNYLTDETGGRRYWPVKCSNNPKLDLLRKERDQLIAEAKKAFKDGEKWYGSHIDTQAFGEQQKRTESDLWDDDIDKYVSSKTRRYRVPGKYQDFIATSEIMGILGIDTEKRNTVIAKRVNRMMRARGWVPLRLQVQIKMNRFAVRGFALAKTDPKVVELNAVQPPEEGMSGAEQGGTQMEFDETREVEGFKDPAIDQSRKSVTFNPGV